MEPGDVTCVFALEEEDDGTALHQYGPCDEFYYILEGEFTVWWGKDASKLDNFYKLEKGDCAYYPTGWKYKVANTGDYPGQVPLLHVRLRRASSEDSTRPASQAESIASTRKLEAMGLSEFATQADLVLSNGKIFTMDRAGTIVDAVAVVR